MEVFGNLFDDLTGLLTIGVVGFSIIVIAYLVSMLISKSKGG